MRIAIVNDSPVAIRAISEAVLESGVHVVAWTAESGKAALAKCLRDCPDLVLMDLVMPGWNGAETTAQILGACSTAVLVVTASVSENCARAFQAMGAGAIDAIDAPAPGDSHTRRAFLDKLAQIGAIVSDESPRDLAAHSVEPGENGGVANDLIVFGASAGGPAALAEILKQLGPVSGESIVIVQHVDQQFVTELADWLSGFCDSRVELVQEGVRLRSGAVYLSAGNAHLVARPDGTLGYDMEPAGLPYRPSVDIFFLSLARHWKGRVFSAVLTGMGKDGAGGLAALRASGHLTVAQDRETSALYGMPKAAADSGAACEILPLNSIAGRIRKWIRDGSRKS